MHIVPDKLKEELKDQYVVYDAKAVRSAWQAITDYSHLQLLQIDEEYRSLSLDNWNKVLQASDTSKQKYIKNFYDCNHFAVLFKAEVGLILVNGCGLVLDFSGEHAFNLIIVGEENKPPSFKFVEPQLDNWIVPNSSPHYNLKGNGLIIL